MVILAIQFKRIYMRDVWYWLATELRLREYERLELLHSCPSLVLRVRQKLAESVSTDHGA